MANQGPEQILPTNSYVATEADGCVKLRMGAPGTPEGCEAISIPGLLKRAVEVAPEVVAMAVKRDDEWKKWTYTQYLEGK